MSGLENDNSKHVFLAFFHIKGFFFFLCSLQTVTLAINRTDEKCDERRTCDCKDGYSTKHIVSLQIQRQIRKF